MRTRRLLVVAAPAAAVLALATPAIASSEGGGGAAAPVSHASTRSKSFAGWELNSTQPSVTITTTIVLPKLKCGKQKDVIDPSVGGYYRQHFSSFSDAGVFVGCVKGKATYFPAFTLNGKFNNFPKLKAHAHDTVVLKAVLQSTGTTLSVSDKTTKSASKKLTGKGVSKVLGPWAADTGWLNSENNLYHVPRFGKLTFSDTLLNGQPFGVASPTQYDRYQGSTLQISTSAFQSDNKTFDTVFHHS